MSEKIKGIVVLILALLAAQAAMAGDFVKGPWIQNVKTDSMVVMWEDSEQEAAAPTVAYGLTTGYELGTVEATYESVNGYHVYTARITGLSSNTLYHYRVDLDSVQSSDATFKTAPPKGTTRPSHTIHEYVGGVNQVPGTA